MPSKSLSTAGRRFSSSRLPLLLLPFSLIMLSTTCVTQTNAEYFSSMNSLQLLGDIELTLVKAYQEYFEKQEIEIANYRKFIEYVKLQHSVAMEDSDDYLGNPINAFTLIKRMVADWANLRDKLKENQPQATFQTTLKSIAEEVEIPNNNELLGAVRGLARMQRVYNMSTYDIINGEFNGVFYGAELEWHDCFEIAVNLFYEKEYQLAIEWFEASLQVLADDKDDIDEEIKDKFELDIMEYLALTHYELGHTDIALAYVDSILESEPDHSIKETQLYISQSVKERKAPILDKRTTSKFYQNYTRLCQGIRLPEPFNAEFNCKVGTKNNPYFILAPLKMEYLNFDPDITLYHGLVNDNRIESIFELAEAYMHRSMVMNGNDSVVQEVRVSQQAWLHYDTPIMQSIKRLVGTVTGFDLRNAESMQTANYGIGGQYDPHPDFFGPKVVQLSDWIGDRIATNMIYLSDVDQGGYTVFPHINRFLVPVKGAMVSWYNLHKSVEPDHRTLHAGCPVIKGSKSIGNIWVHSGYQEFIRPCGLEPDDYKSVGYEFQKQFM